MFDHNFAVRSEGSADAAPRGGYGGGGSDPGGDGSGVLVLRARTTTSATTSRPTPTCSASAWPGRRARCAFRPLQARTRGAPPRPGRSIRRRLRSSSSRTTKRTARLQIGVDCDWNGVITNFTVWNVARHGIVGMPDRTAGDRRPGRARRARRSSPTSKRIQPASGWATTRARKSSSAAPTSKGCGPASRARFSRAPRRRPAARTRARC